MQFGLKTQKCEYCCLYARFIWLFYKCLRISSTSLLRIRASQGAAIFVRSLSTKSRKMLALRATYTFAIHSGLVHDVIDTAGHKMAALSVFAFGDFQTWIFNQRDEQSNENCCVFIYCSILIYRANNVASVLLPFWLLLSGKSHGTHTHTHTHTHTLSLSLTHTHTHLFA